MTIVSRLKNCLVGYFFIFFDNIFENRFPCFKLTIGKIIINGQCILFTVPIQNEYIEIYQAVVWWWKNVPYGLL